MRSVCGGEDAGFVVGFVETNEIENAGFFTALLFWEARWRETGRTG